MLQFRLISSLEKCFHDDHIANFPAITRLRLLQNQRQAFQVVVTETELLAANRVWRHLILEGPLAEAATVRQVVSIPSRMPVYRNHHDGDVLRTEPGLFPDLLEPLHMEGRIAVAAGQLNTYWIELDPERIPGGLFPAGNSTLTVRIQDSKGEDATVLGEATLNVEVLAASLPPQTIRFTQWFHTDCLSTYYGVDVFSERYWEITENFMKTAVRSGINMILTPVLTPPLDTEVGGERPTVQLVDVTVENGEYRFGFDRLDRWIELCNRTGIRYFEISHFFTQWGAAHAPKVIATVDGVKKKIFGWESDASEGEYPVFLRAFVRALLDHMIARGDDKRCYFHISDEPHADQLEQYNRSKDVVAELLKDYPIMDALSNFEFYEQGVVKLPIPATNHIQPFLDAKVPGLWTYYCCGQTVGVSNRMFAMPGARTRFIGTQFYKYHIVGFLQWGYNFYYNQYSHDLINPYLESTGEFFFPSGDGYSVYPAPDGTAYESIRLEHFREGLDDQRLMNLCESLYDYDTVVNAVEKVCGTVTFDHCECSAARMTAVRDAVLDLIAAKL